jgi:hypothetical protein
MNRTGQILFFALSVASVVLALALHEPLFAVPASLFGIVLSLDLMDLRKGGKLK